jgi:hypothetical protein
LITFQAEKNLNIDTVTMAGLTNGSMLLKKEKPSSLML